MQDAWCLRGTWGFLGGEQESHSCVLSTAAPTQVKEQGDLFAFVWFQIASCRAAPHGPQRATRTPPFLSVSGTVLFKNRQDPKQSTGIQKNSVNFSSIFKSLVLSKHRSSDAGYPSKAASGSCHRKW